MFKNKHYISFLFICMLAVAYAQKKPQYIIEGDEVVFKFDARNYKKFTKENAVFRYNLNKIAIEDVTIAGEFNNWSKNNWRMKKTGEYTYELRKKLKDFDDEFSWQFKFVINNKFWAEPTTDFDQITESEKSYWFRKIYNHTMYTVKPDSIGNAHFYLKGHENAQKVILSGTFNNWDENNFKMKKVKGGWKLSLQLSPNTYQYKFIVDNNWMEDPDNPNKIYNEYNTFNSVLTIDKTVVFKLKGYDNASEVILTGSFNSWDEKEYHMIRKKNTWYYTLQLEGGKYHYKFIIDGRWITDPDNPIQEYDTHKNINSVIMVD